MSVVITVKRCPRCFSILNPAKPENGGGWNKNRADDEAIQQLARSPLFKGLGIEIKEVEEACQKCMDETCFSSEQIISMMKESKKNERAR